MIEPALAKINLTLAIKGRLPSGYHALESLVAFADLGETVQVESEPLQTGNGVEVATTGPFAAAIEGDNLVAKAVAVARAVKPELGGGRFLIEKQIPVAAGLGGGSADAAAALRLLRRRSPQIADGLDWNGIAAGIGADVPVCVGSRAGLVWNIGERFVPAPQPLGLAAVLVNANVPVPADKTRRVFSVLAAASIAAPPEPTLPPWTRLMPWLQAASNDLEPAARAVLPGAADVERALRALPDALVVRMSGAGPTWFALFQSEDRAERARGQLTSVFSDWWIRAVRLN